MIYITKTLWGFSLFTWCVILSLHFQQRDVQYAIHGRYVREVPKRTRKERGQGIQSWQEARPEDETLSGASISDAVYR